MKDDIGEVAGKVWTALAEKGEITISRLPKVLKVKSEHAYQGLGWLAREGKVSYRADSEGRTMVSLTPAERGSVENTPKNGE